MSSNLKVVGTINLCLDIGSNESGFTGLLKEKTKFSIWFSDDNYTAAALDQIRDDVKTITLGESKEVEVSIWYTGVAQAIKEGSILELGVPFYSIGTLRVDKILEVPEKGVFD